MANRQLRNYFRQNTQINNADGTTTPGDRFLDKDIPTEETFKNLFDSIAFILNKEDTAKETSQGLVKLTNGSNAKSNITPNDGFAYAAQIKNLPTLKDSIQTIKDLTSKLVTVVPDASSLDRNDYLVELSSDFVNYLSSELTTLQSDINTVSASVPDITSIQSDITTIQGNITTLQASVSGLESASNTNKAGIAGNSMNIATNAANIASNTAAIAAINPADNRFLGEIVTLSANSAPSASWLLCDGSAISRTTYATLFTLIGTSYGVGDGSTTFNLPNLEGKVQRGYKSGDPAYGLAATGGADTLTLASGHLPAHTHGIDITSTIGLTTYSSDGTSVDTARSGDSSGTAIDTSIQTQVVGTSDANTTTNTPLDIKNSYLAVFYFIKVAS